MRPASARDVLASLPGGDPLAAALAGVVRVAGEAVLELGDGVGVRCVAVLAGARVLRSRQGLWVAWIGGAKSAGEQQDFHFRKSRPQLPDDFADTGDILLADPAGTPNLLYFPGVSSVLFDC